MEFTVIYACNPWEIQMYYFHWLYEHPQRRLRFKPVFKIIQLHHNSTHCLRHSNNPNTTHLNADTISAELKYLRAQKPPYVQRLGLSVTILLKGPRAPILIWMTGSHSVHPKHSEQPTWLLGETIKKLLFIHKG